MDLTVDEFAAEVGSTDPVSVSGTATRGGPVDGARVVRAPSGILRIDAAEMVIECGAGTPMAEIHDALARVGQTVSIPTGGTVGGALAVGHSDVTRLGHGAIRDVLLQTHYVSGTGKLTKAGGPTVKNVSGFDLCRLFVGSWGSLGFFGDVLLRTRPLARSSRWFSSERDPFDLLAGLYRPVAILWDGTTTWVRLDGDARDVDTTVTAMGLVAVDGPPPLPGPHRWSLSPSALTTLRDHEPGTFVAEIGVGIVHHTVEPRRAEPEPAVVELHRRIKAQFDPSGRLNPGLDPMAPGSIG